MVLTGCVVEPADGDAVALRESELPIAAPLGTMQVPAPLPAAHCEVDVTGVGVLDLETDYLPNVVRCENGGANLEALKAQAIAARSVAYYNMETAGEICDSQGCQVYSCGGTPNDLQIQAVEETSGLYLMFNNTLTYGFYVAGDSDASPPTCVGVSGSTEGWVTYNSGRSGTDVEQTELGFVHDPADPGYGQNRGCMSQWGARCLENDLGADYLDILRFYYGEDIQLVQAKGECVNPVEPPPQGSSSSGGEDESSGGMVGEAAGGEDDTGSAATGGDPSMSGEGGASGGNPPPGETTDDQEGTSTPGNSSGGRGAGALPDGFGGGTGPSGCACSTSSPSRSESWGLLGLLGLGLAVRRRRRTPGVPPSDARTSAPSPVGVDPS